MTGGSSHGRYLRVRELLHEPGFQRHDEGAFALEPAGLTSAALRDDTEVTYALTLEARGNRVTVRGAARGEWAGPCRRCLEVTDGDVTAEIDEIFETRHAPGETWPITDGLIDLEPVIREALLLELPLAPLCREDCAGPDPDRYPTEPVGDNEVDEQPPRDPRWAALDDLTVGEPEGTDP
ncbi:MAG TPA: DUF177 domain-containing protein [Acidimicrobiales bacterium]|nr:DUF177 domain-containing protein [Acidimicrobiales bacterium]